MAWHGLAIFEQRLDLAKEALRTTKQTQQPPTRLQKRFCQEHQAGGNARTATKRRFFAPYGLHRPSVVLAEGRQIFWRYLQTWLIMDVTLVGLDFLNIGSDFEGPRGRACDEHNWEAS